MSQLIRSVGLVSFVVSLLVLVGACGGPANPSGLPTYEYAGSGSDWRWSLNADGTFSASELIDSAKIEGTFTRLPSGFVKLTVKTSSGSSAPGQGTIRYGLEVPGVAFLVQALLTTEHGIITNVGAGKCPTADFNSNWILTQYPIGFDMSNPAAAVFGTFQWSNDSSSGVMPKRFAIAGDYQNNGSDNSPISGSCNQGVMPTSMHGLPSTVYFAPQDGAGIVKVRDADGVLALPSKPIQSTDSLKGNYAGLIINLNDLFLPVRPVQGAIDATGKIRVDGLLDVEPAVIDPFYNGTATFDALNSPSDGFAKVTVTTGNGTGKMACMASVDVLGSGKNILFCVGEAPGSVSMNAHSYNVLLVTK